LFFAYRDFVGDADHELEAFGFGRAHHRVLHFVHRYPGLKVADLLDVLRITKQSLGRVLKQLLDEAISCKKPAITTGGSACSMPPRRARHWWQNSRVADRPHQPRGRRSRPGRHRDRAAIPARDDRPRRSRQGAGNDFAGGANRGDERDARSNQHRHQRCNDCADATKPADDAPHLLLVDDDRRIRDLLSRFLSGEGYRVTTAMSASDARAKLLGLHFDLLILDVMMPGETGFDLARFIRKSSTVRSSC